MDYPIRTLQQIRPLLLGFRKRAGLSQAAVAALLGVTQQSYAKIEANPSATSVERLFTILRLLGSEILLSGSADAAAAGPLETTLDTALAQSAAPTVPKSAAKARKGRVTAPPKVIPPSKQTEHW
jgi:HTH-type transcriptional regulator/antitoxin HipB